MGLLKGASRAILLDRDGTLMIDTGYPKHPDEVRLLPNALTAMRRLRDAGYRLILVSNQSGIGRGLVTPEQARAVHERLVERLAEHGLELDASYYCPHAPEDDCECRKPAPGMLLRAAREHGLDLARSFMVGDKPGDVEAGRRAGCRGLLIRGDDDWPNVAAIILDSTTTNPP